MKVIQPFVIIPMQEMDSWKMASIEYYGRVCYKSKSSSESADENYKFIKRLVDNGHESVLEHEKVSVCIVCDRGVSHELVRHRIASFSQESTRFCNYSQDRFGNEITVIEPFFFDKDSDLYKIWYENMLYCEKQYFNLLQLGATPQEARSVLPNSLKTEIVISANMREWRHIFKLRCDKKAHPQMRQIMIPLHKTFKDLWPPLFEDIVYDESPFDTHPEWLAKIHYDSFVTNLCPMSRFVP